MIKCRQIKPSTLTEEEQTKLTDELFNCYQEVFNNVTPETFSKDFILKWDYCWYIYDDKRPENMVGVIVMRILEVPELGCKIISHGPGFMLKEYRGMKNALPVEIDLFPYKLQALEPEVPLFVFDRAISPAGYIRAIHNYETYWPNLKGDVPGGIKRLFNAAPRYCYGENFRLNEKNPFAVQTSQPWTVKDSTAPRKSTTNPNVDFFFQENPDHKNNFGLMLLIPISAANLEHLFNLRPEAKAHLQRRSWEQDTALRRILEQPEDFHQLDNKTGRLKARL